jgi:hypothetical protein
MMTHALLEIIFPRTNWQAAESSAFRLITRRDGCPPSLVAPADIARAINCFLLDVFSKNHGQLKILDTF